MREKIVLICKDCFSRNYQTTKQKATATKPFEVKKYCPRCKSHTVHKESK